MILLSHLTKRFGGVVAVEDVSLEVRRGEFLTLLGPSGCGKTTLLRMISGFETPTLGKVMLDGQDVTGLPPERRDVNQVFQSYALFPHMTVAGNIGFGLQIRRMSATQIRQRVEEAVHLVGLAGLEKRLPAQLSGGQRQRVALARALVCQPKVLLLDEPLAALDAKLRRAMQVELKRLQQRLQITFIFVTHDQDEAMVMSDRIAVVNAGRIEQIDTPAQIYHRPRTRFVADFLGQTNLLPARKIEVRGPSLLEIAGEFRLPLTPDQWPSPAPTCLASIRPEKLTLNGAAGSVEAIVKEALFRGPISHLTLSTPAGNTLLVATSESFSPGTRLGVSFAAEDVVLLSDE